MRYAWIEQHRDDYAVSRMCRLLAVSRTGYLQWRRRPPSARAQANARLDAQVAAMHAASKGSYGRPRIVRGLREQGLQVGLSGYAAACNGKRCGRSTSAPTG